MAHVNTFRRCCRPGCGRPAVATLIYAYADSTAVVGPLAPVAEPHSWDLCERHSSNISAPVGWDMVRVEHVEIDDDELESMEEADLTALAGEYLRAVKAHARRAHRQYTLMAGSALALLACLVASWFS